ncbi:di-heme oxidoredictase family protein, partial [Wenyingzhuangia sp. 1_MG-2023]|nr:di-heme oxidoredictase family protein [Wenyingzhuangia sp. 1_MG-2023]
MGLLELIAQSDLEALADPEDADGNGISGRQNRVWDARSQRWLPGRFGHKANRPNMDMIVASAFANDIGISNPLFPSQPCTAYQPL